MRTPRTEDERAMLGRIHRRLTTIAEDLEELKLRQDALLEERVQLWERGHELGAKRAQLARSSRVVPVTVSQTRRRRSTGKR